MSLDEPIRLPAHQRELRLAVLVTAAVLMVVAAYVAGRSFADRTTVSKAAFLVGAAPALVLMVFLLLALQGVSWQPRIQGSRLVGTSLVGRTAVDLAALTGVSTRSARQGTYLSLRDETAALTVSVTALAGQGLNDRVGEALRAAQQAGRLVLPADVAAMYRIPALPGAPRGRGRGGATVQLQVLGVVVLLFAGLVLGATLGG